MQPCEQADRIMHIESDLTNHKQWRKETTAQLSNIEIAVATIDERLRNKLGEFDRHIAEGNSFRLALIGTMISVGVMACSAFIAYGKLEQKVNFIYDKSYGVGETIK